MPSPHELTVSVKFVPDEAFTEKAQPVAVPALEKSASPIPVTFWDITIE